MNQQEKLKQRRLEQEENMRDRRVDLGIVSKRIFSEFDDKPKEEEPSRNILIEEFKKNIFEEYVDEWDDDYDEEEDDSDEGKPDKLADNYKPSFNPFRIIKPLFGFGVAFFVG